MDSGELIELFYNRTYEKFINKHILDDKNYIVPRQQLTNYVNELINIPFIQFVEYLKTIEIKQNVEVSDVTQFTSFSACEIDMCNALIWANNPGYQYLDIGRLFPNKVNTPNNTTYKRYGEINIKASSQLGLSFEYYGYWYLSCLGYIYPDLDKEVRSKLLARTITRNSLYQCLLIEILNHDVKPENYMDLISEQIVKRRLRNVCAFLEICLDECREQNINIHYLIKNYDYYEKHDVKQHPIGTDKNLCKYLDEFDYHRLSIDTTTQLIKKYREGDHSASDILVKGYMRLVISIAQTYVNRGIEYGDLIQEGIIGLIKAFDHYNVEFNGGFSKYAQWWIRQSMSEAIFTQSLIVQVPTNTRITHRKVWKEIKLFEQKNGYPPSVIDINIDDEADSKIIQMVSNMPEQLETLTVFSDNWDNIISDCPLPDNTLMKESLTYYVFALTNKLNQKHAQILRSTYGIKQEEKAYSQIGMDLGVTRERIRQIVESSIRKLRSKTTLAEMEDIDVQNDNISNKTKNNRRNKQATVYSVNEQPKKAVNNTINPEEQQLNDLAILPKKNTINTTEPLKVAPKTYNNSRDNNAKSHSYTIKPITIKKGKKSPNYNVVNEGKRCYIFDSNGVILYSSTGRIKQMGGCYYRIYYTYSSIIINRINNYKDSEFKTGERIVSAKNNSTLYKKLDINNYVDLIEEIRCNGEKRVKVKNIWFNQAGDLFGVSNKYGIISKNIQHELNNDSGYSNKANHQLREATIGDRIIYNTKQCVVVDKQEMDGSVRLIVRYDNGIIDNLQNDCNKYRVI